MEVRIKHRLTFLIPLSLLFFAVGYFAVDIIDDPVAACVIIGIMMLLITCSTLMAFGSNNNASVTLKIEDRKLFIKYPIGERVIDADCITELRFLHTQHASYRRGSIKTENYYRAALIIEGNKDGKRFTLKLTDSATGKNKARLPDKDVPLFAAYSALCKLTGIQGSIQDHNVFEDSILSKLFKQI